MPDRAVIFDMDGVMVDSEQYWPELEEDILSQLGIDDPHDTINDVKGMDYREIYHIVDDAFNLDISEDEFAALYDEKAETLYGETVSLMEGFTGLVQTLRGNGVRIAVATSSPPHWRDTVFQRFDLEGLFDTVVSAQQIQGKGKPQPDIYLQTAEQLGVDPENCIVVEDSPNGIRAAENAGMTCIGYRTQSNRDDDLAEADSIVETPAELREQLTKLTEV